jgi:hypothetical protein
LPSQGTFLSSPGVHRSPHKPALTIPPPLRALPSLVSSPTLTWFTFSDAQVSAQWFLPEGSQVFICFHSHGGLSFTH